MDFPIVLFFVIYAFRCFLAKLRAWSCGALFRLRYPQRVALGFRPVRKQPAANIQLFRRKPDWVVNKILWLKALNPDFGCRKIANEFNRLYAEARGVAVSKSFVAAKLRAYLYLIEVIRRNIKNRPAYYVPKNLVWGLDLTAIVDGDGVTHYVLGVVEHNTRYCLSLHALPDKATGTILSFLREAIREIGCRPKKIRTDNEAIFGPKFTEGLLRLGIGHQHTQKHSPWQNGRIERFFGSLQERTNYYGFLNFEHLITGLAEFRFWYNHVRPHQALDGWTPAEAWEGKGARNATAKSVEYYSAWEGLLQGTLIRV